MASVYKPTYTRSIPPGAARCKLNGRAAVRHVDGKGKKHVRPIKRSRKSGESVMVCQQRTWWMKYRLPDGTIRRQKGFKDKLATEQEAARREREAEQAAAGVRVVDSSHLTAPLTEHIEAFIADLERAGRSPKHYELLDSRLRKTAAACGWETLRQITPDSMSRYLGTLKAEGKAGKTQNEYLAAAKGFCNWCVKTLRLAANPLVCVTKTKDVEKRYHRRALTIDEATRLLAVAGPRRLVYLTALSSGLRRSELRQLQWGDLCINPDEKPLRIVLRASTTKAYRADTIPLRNDVAAELRAAKPADAEPTDRVFPSIPKMAMFKRDLEGAGIPHIDASGRVADFHGLRVTYGTMLAKAGVAPRVAMELMRHTDVRLTMGIYTDPRILDTSRAVNELPSLLDERPGANGKIAPLRTGTNDMPVQGPNQVIAQNRGFECPEVSISDQLGACDNEKTPEKEGFFIGAAGFEPATS